MKKGQHEKGEDKGAGREDMSRKKMGKDTSGTKDGRSVVILEYKYCYIADMPHACTRNLYDDHAMTQCIPQPMYTGSDFKIKNACTP